MYWIDESSQARGVGEQRDFYCDDASDINNLPTSSSMGVQQGDDTVSCQPCGKGSFCLCIADATGYFLNSSDLWVEA